MEPAVKKVIIVEGASDRRRVREVLNEPAEIVCTNGTIGLERLDDIIEALQGKDVYVLVDSDRSGEKLRHLFKREFPEAKHIYIDRAYREVATAPKNHLSAVLLKANFQVKPEFL
jgi:Toprim domain.